MSLRQNSLAHGCQILGVDVGLFLFFYTTVIEVVVQSQTSSSVRST